MVAISSSPCARRAERSRRNISSLFTGSRSEHTINLSWCRKAVLQSRAQLTSSCFRAGKQARGGGPRSMRVKNSKLHRSMFHSHSSVCPPCQGEHKGKFGAKTGLCTSGCISFFFFPPSIKFHPHAVLVRG